MKATLYLVTAAIIWGLNFHFAQIMLQSSSFIEAGFWRFLLGVFTLVIISYRQLPDFQDFTADFKGLSLVGLVGIFGFNIFFFWGMLTTSPLNAALIVGLNPALTLLFSKILLNTQLQLKHIIGIVVAFVGVLCLLVKGDFAELQHFSFAIGDLLIMIASTLFALQHIWIKKYTGGISIKKFTLLTNLICLVCFIVVMPWVSVQKLDTHGSPFWISVLGIGCLGTAVAFLMWNEGVKKIGPDKAGIFINLVPLSTAISGVFLNQPLLMYHLVSGLLIISGLLVMQYQRKVLG